MWGNYNTSSGLALKGYDPVAYIQDEKAMPGSSEFMVAWGDANWQFASAEKWHIHDGKPFVFADNNVQADWVAGIDDGTLEAAAANWEKR